MFPILGPRNETLSLPLYSDFANGLENSEIYLSLHRLLSFCLKTPFMMGGNISLLTQITSMTRD